MAELRSRQRLSSDDEARRHRIDLTRNLPATVVLCLLEWLAVPDLLAMGMVDCSFRDLTAKELPWKAAARHLWKSALLDGQQSLSGEAAGIHENARTGEVCDGRASGARVGDADACCACSYLSYAVIRACFEPCTTD